MAVGRHRAESTTGRDAAGDGGMRDTGSVPAAVPAAANHELLGWGMFLAATAAAAMVWVGIDWLITAACCLLLLLSFAAVWRVQRRTGPDAGQAVAVTEPAAAAAATAATAAAAVPAPSASSKSSESAALPADPGTAGPAPADGQGTVTGTEPVPSEPADQSEPITRKQMRAADPSTGLLPVVPVFARVIPLAPGNGRKTVESVVAGGRRERRHAAGTATPGPAGSNHGTGPAGLADQARTTDPADTMARTLAAINAGRTSAPVILQAAAYGPAPAPAGTDAPAAPVYGPAPEGPGADAPLTAAGTPAAESRWTRTFGPPETGQLPVQRYVAGVTAAAPADPDRPDRRQRSHSSL